MRVQKRNKAFAYRVPIGDYNYLQCMYLAKLENVSVHFTWKNKKQGPISYEKWSMKLYLNDETKPVDPRLLNYIFWGLKALCVTWTNPQKWLVDSIWNRLITTNHVSGKKGHYFCSRISEPLLLFFYLSSSHMTFRWQLRHHYWP